MVANTKYVRACVRVCVCACVRACVSARTDVQCVDKDIITCGAC